MTAELTSGSGTPLTIDAPITLRLPAGAALFVVHGEAWITQDGSIDDVILPAGRRFDVPSRAPLVISATRGHADLYLVGPSAARRSASCNVHDFVRSDAAGLRRAEASRLLDGVVHRATAWLRRMRALAAPRLRVPTQ